MNEVNVKETMNGVVESTFFTPQKVDADAAYARLALTRKMLKMYQRDINDTNTSDITGEHKNLYIEIERILQMIMLKEQQLILDGE